MKFYGTTSFSVLIKKSVYRGNIADQGFCSNWHCFQLMVKDFTLNKYIFVMGVINSMPTAWRWLIKTAIVPVISNTPAILINNNLVPILDASSNHISWSVLAKNQTVIFLCNINPNFGISLQIGKPYCIYEQETF